MPKRRKFQKFLAGFTILESLLAITLFSVIAAMSVWAYSNWPSVQTVRLAAEEVAQSVRLARNRALSRVNDSAHGIYFLTNEKPAGYVIYQGDSYAARNQGVDREFRLNRALILETAGLGADINFSRGAAFPGAFGRIIIKNEDGLKFKAVNISDFGLVEVTSEL